MTTKIKTPVANEHELTETIVIDIFYPDHPPRTESNLFTKTKHHLIKVLDVPCKVCGTKDKREVHHFHCEWADSDGVDWSVGGRMRTLHPDFPWSTFDSPEDFIDSEYNMMVLCEKHHRARDHGIHLLPYPIWVMQSIQKQDFIFSPDDSSTAIVSPEDTSKE